jgi:hypothetical protein
MSLDVANSTSAIFEFHDFSRNDLVTAFEKFYGQSPSRKMGRELMARAVAHQIQLRASTSSQSSLDRKLATYARQLREIGQIKIAPSSAMKPGSRLIREWQGKLHEVLVRDNGFVYRDREYRSLSAIARDITGTRWSGPAFFGLKETAARTGVAHGA